jgi:hypothetical protein
LDSQYADAIKPPSARTGDGWPPDRRPPIRTEHWNFWLPCFGAASGLFWDGLLSILIGPGWWMLAPITVGALIGAIFAAS